MELFTGYYKCPIGCIEIKSDLTALISVKFLEKAVHVKNMLPNSELITNAINQLDEYFNHTRKEFDLVFHLMGTDFQVRVWNKLLEIPYGKTSSYGNIALKLGSNKNMRAVGNANGKNPFAIIVPCHRVIGEKGNLVGYAGGIWRKKWLLDHEASVKQLNISF